VTSIGTKLINTAITLINKTNNNYGKTINTLWFLSVYLKPIKYYR